MPVSDQLFSSSTYRDLQHGDGAGNNDENSNP